MLDIYQTLKNVLMSETIENVNTVETEMLTLKQYAERQNISANYLRQVLAVQSRYEQTPKLEGVVKIEKFGGSWALHVPKLKVPPVVKKEEKKKKVS